GGGGGAPRRGGPRVRTRPFPGLFPRARPARHSGARRRRVPGPAEAARWVGHAQRLDPAARNLAAAVQRRVGTGPRADALHGVWLGQPGHPTLTRLPLGFWTSAALPRFVPGSGRARRALVPPRPAPAAPASAAPPRPL